MSRDTPDGKNGRSRKHYGALRETTDAEDAQFGQCLKVEFKQRPDLFRGPVDLLREKKPPHHIGALRATTKDGTQMAFPFAHNLTLEFSPTGPVTAAERAADDRASQYLTDTYIKCDPNGKDKWPETWTRLRKAPKPAPK